MIETVFQKILAPLWSVLVAAFTLSDKYLSLFPPLCKKGKFNQDH